LHECQFKFQITLIYKGPNQMKNISRIAYIVAAFTFISATHASAETLQELATKTHYHGIAFARSGTAVLLLASHHGLFTVDKTGNATQVSVVQDYMGFSPAQISAGVGGPVDFHQMDVSPADPQTIYGNYGGLQVSHDGGNTWAAVGPAPDSLIAIAASSVKTETLYAATKNGLHISINGGVNWQPLAFDGEVVSMVKSGPHGVLMAFVLGKGLMKATEEKPMEWTSMSNDFGDAIVLHLAINPKDNTQLALTTQDNAVLESKDSGVTWVSFGQAQ
jgi:plastocyanin